jgi:PPK2 family polyphosphate:nucleotide phosphotransferase
MGLRDRLRVPAGVDFDLSSVDPGSTPGLSDSKKHDKAWGRERLKEIGADLATFQEQLYASAKVGGSQERVLLVLQAMDCGGKDGTTRQVAGTMNPQGLSIIGFGPPTAEELAHDFLWRIGRAVPAAGQIGVFNRSHYEDVLVVRVHDLVPPEIWEARYDRINEFEASLVATGVTMIKVMLHISKDEQAKRLGERLADPTKYWKYNPGDLGERARWDDYRAAYNAALSRCSTDVAPWYVVPANKKWYRDWAVATILYDTLAEMGLGYPPATFDVAEETKRLMST